MGVVRDVTVEQLAQAVGGIDTSGLAKDTTLQATNTALGNINTTLGGITTNDPPTDTTQQSIATAIINLGTALGSDKANIDGSNIANPSAFRQNIEIGYTLINTYTSNAQTLYHDLTGYSSIVIVAYFTNTSNVTYIVGSLSMPTSEIVNTHPIVCFNDGTIRKGQLNFKSTYATTENFSNITSLKIFGVN